MQMYLKRYFWILPLLIVMVCAALMASAVNHWVEGNYLLGDQGKTQRPKAKKAVAAKPTVSKDGAMITARNMFCSTCEPPPPEAPTSEPVADGDTVPNTALPLALVATSVSTPNDFSSATVVNTQTAKSGAYWYGEDIPDAGRIEKIEPRYVHFRNKSSQRLERIDLLGAAPPPVARVSEEAPKDTKPPKGTDPDFMAALDSGIKKVDDTHFEIDRGLVEKVLADPNLVARSARIVPSIKDGKANGFKVYAIRPNSAFAKLGLQNGDTLHSVNGFEMTSPDKALEVYTKVKSANNLSISVTRRGQPVTMDYTIK